METGGIDGIPDADGTFQFTVTVTDSSVAGATGSGLYEIGVVDVPNTQPSINATMLIAGTDGALYAVADGVFHDDTSLGRNVESGSRQQVHLRIGFAPVYIFSRYNSLKHLPR